MGNMTRDLNDKMGASCADLREEHSRQREFEVERPRGRRGLGLFEEEK